MRNNEIARAILDDNEYVVLATADMNGKPWATPVWFAHADYREVVWVSAPEAKHSLNIALRPEVAMVVYDSTVRPGEGQAVYMSGTAGLAEIGLLDVFSRRAMRSGLGEWSPRRVSGKARLRLYRAEVHEWSILDPDAQADVRVRVEP
jgi:nitroimidazol reductase NimA-like FMN-containing flavoprotein (pyridoxamine 5'-phosphate oxidase superfamily)